MFSTSQEKMNRLFLGQEWSLAERYSDMSKSIFIALSFAAIYPYAYFNCAMANLFSFLADKYCLFRVWKQQEPENATVTGYHRASLAIAFLAHAVFTLWYFADWPFEDHCRTKMEVPDWVMEGITSNVVDNHVYKECDMQSKGFIFGVRGGRSYMTPAQEMLILMYKIVTACTGFVIVVAYFGPGILKMYKDVFVGHVHIKDEPTDTKFSDVDFIEGYIPGLVDPMYNKPLLACNLKNLDTQHIHWEGNWDAYNLCSEHEFPGMSVEERNKYFGEVRSYPMEGGEPKLTYRQYIERNFPTLVGLLKEDSA